MSKRSKDSRQPELFPSNSSEVERLRKENNRLQAENERLNRQNAGLVAEIERLKILVSLSTQKKMKYPFQTIR
jgi:predicted RNase H-like nuclease (RuvC/YqgF family)